MKKAILTLKPYLETIQYTCETLDKEARAHYARCIYESALPEEWVCMMLDKVRCNRYTAFKREVETAVGLSEMLPVMAARL